MIKIYRFVRDVNNKIKIPLKFKFFIVVPKYNQIESMSEDSLMKVFFNDKDPQDCYACDAVSVDGEILRSIEMINQRIEFKE